MSEKLTFANKKRTSDESGMEFEDSFENQKNSVNGRKIEGVKDTDILCGRGQNASHPGNIMLRNLINDYKQAYQDSKKRDEKTKITNEIVAKLLGGPEPARFLLKDSETDKWVAVSEEYAKDKVSHALRAKPREPSKKPKLADGEKQKRNVKRPTIPSKLESTVTQLIDAQQELLKALIDKDSAAVTSPVHEVPKEDQISV